MAMWCIHCFTLMLEDGEAHPSCALLEEGRPLAADALAARRTVAARMEIGVGDQVLLGAILGELIELRVQGERQGK